MARGKRHCHRRAGTGAAEQVEPDARIAKGADETEMPAAERAAATEDRAKRAACGEPGNAFDIAGVVEGDVMVKFDTVRVKPGRRTGNRHG